MVSILGHMIHPIPSRKRNHECMRAYTEQTRDQKHHPTGSDLVPLQERPQAPGHPALPLQFWLRIQTVTSKSSNHQVMGLFSVPYILNCSQSTEANQQETQPAVPKVCYSLTQKKGALSFQDTHGIIKKKHYPSIPVHILMRQFAIKSLCCHVHLQNYRNFRTKIVNEK